eukprot:sb/3474903/
MDYVRRLSESTGTGEQQNELLLALALLRGSNRGDHPDRQQPTLDLAALSSLLEANTTVPVGSTSPPLSKEGGRAATVSSPGAILSITSSGGIMPVATHTIQNPLTGKPMMFQPTLGGSIVSPTPLQIKGRSS